jgi:hypothetical protein
MEMRLPQNCVAEKPSRDENANMILPITEFYLVRFDESPVFLTGQALHTGVEQRLPTRGRKSK